MDPVTHRLEELERRVRELETSVAWLSEGATFPATGPDLPRGSAATPLPPEAMARVAPARVPPPLPTRKPTAPPCPLGSPRVAEAPTRAPGDLERWLGGVLLARVGIGAVVLAAAYFAQLAYRNVPDAFKVLSLYGLAAALLGAGHLLRARAGTRYAGLLQGGAVAVAYVAGLAAALRYHLVAPEVGLLLLAGAAALGTWLAKRLEVEALASVSALGALAAPALLRLLGDGHGLVLVLLVGVNAWTAWTEQRWRWKATRVVVFAGACLLALEWFQRTRGWDALDLLLGMHAVLALLLAPELLLLLKGRGPARIFSVLASVAFGLLLAMHAGVEALRDVGGGGRLPGTALAAAGGWLALLYALGAAPSARAARGAAPGWWASLEALGAAGRERDAAFFVQGLARLAGIATVLGAWALWHDRGEAVRLLPLLALLAPLLLLLQRRLGVGALGALAAALVAWVTAGDEAGRFVHAPSTALAPTTALGLLLLALVPAGALATAGRRPAARIAGGMLGSAVLLTGLGTLATLTSAWWLATWAACAAWFVLGAVAARLRRDRTLAGTAALGLLLVALGWGLSSLSLGRAPGWAFALDPHTLTALVVAAAAWGARRLLSDDGLLDPDARGALVGAALALLACAGGREVHLLTRGMEGAWSPVLMSVYVTFVAAGMLVAGFVRQARALRLVALLLFAGVVLKVGLYDLAAARLELRVLVTLVLGLTLLASAFAYARTARGGAKGTEDADGEAASGDARPREGRVS